jgi:hypothetical protein
MYMKKEKGEKIISLFHMSKYSTVQLHTCVRGTCIFYTVCIYTIILICTLSCVHTSVLVYHKKHNEIPVHVCMSCMYISTQ